MQIHKYNYLIFLLASSGCTYNQKLNTINNSILNTTKEEDINHNNIIIDIDQNRRILLIFNKNKSDLDDSKNALSYLIENLKASEKIVILLQYSENEEQTIQKDRRQSVIEYLSSKVARERIIVQYNNNECKSDLNQEIIICYIQPNVKKTVKSTNI